MAERNEATEKAYEAIESGQATGKIRKEATRQQKAIERGIAKFVAVAKDVQPQRS